MKYLYTHVIGEDIVFQEEREYFAVKDSEEFCGTHHTKPILIGGYADDGFGNPIKRQ